MQRQKVPGLALGVVSGDDVVAAKGYGYANVELSVPVSEETLFQSGSIGKAFTAMKPSPGSRLAASAVTRAETT